MKKVLKKLIEVVGYEVINFGSDSDEPVDYSDYAHEVAGSIKKNETDFGILLCGSGQGVAITANKYQYIRAAVCWGREGLKF